MRSLERSVEEVLLPALEMAAHRPENAAELEHACRWATGWLHSARRLTPPAARSEGVLLLDSGSPLGLEAVYVQALELFLRRAGLRVLLLSADLAESRFANAMRALKPVAVVLCGAGARLDVVGAPAAADPRRAPGRAPVRLSHGAPGRGPARRAGARKRAGRGHRGARRRARQRLGPR